MKMDFPDRLPLVLNKTIYRSFKQTKLDWIKSGFQKEKLRLCITVLIKKPITEIYLAKEMEYFKKIRE